jgi:hypothetical protein
MIAGSNSMSIVSLKKVDNDPVVVAGSSHLASRARGNRHPYRYSDGHGRVENSNPREDENLPV